MGPFHSRQSALHPPALEANTGVKGGFFGLHPPSLPLQQGARELAGFGAQPFLPAVEGMGLQGPKQRRGPALAGRAATAVEQGQTIGGIEQTEGFDHPLIPRLAAHQAMTTLEGLAKTVGPEHMARPGRHLLRRVQRGCLADHGVAVHRLELGMVAGPQRPQIQGLPMQGTPKQPPSIMPA